RGDTPAWWRRCSRPCSRGHRTKVPSDLGDLVTLLALSFALVLVLPKHGWSSIPAHLREAALGHRAYIFGPPATCGRLADDLVERCFQLVRREWPRVIDLGAPLYVLAVLLEIRGAERRGALEAAWRGSTSALILDHLAGQRPESALRDLLRER